MSKIGVIGYSQDKELFKKAAEAMAKLGSSAIEASEATKLVTDSVLKWKKINTISKPQSKYHK